MKPLRTLLRPCDWIRKWPKPNNWAYALASQGRLHEAADHFAAALRINPNLVEARLNVARIREQLGEAR